MSRRATSFVLAYHGCDAGIAAQAVAGKISLLHSDRKYDWLGPGAYFWEADPRRALEWAELKVARGDYKKAAVVGAAIDLGNCLDLQSRADMELVQSAYLSFVAAQALAGLPLPENRRVAGDAGEDRALRFLDCAVIRHLHEIIAAQPEGPDTIAPFDTVRGMFPEGAPAYPGSGFRELSHVQIAVRNNACIKGLFVPLDL